MDTVILAVVTAICTAVVGAASYWMGYKDGSTMGELRGLKWARDELKKTLGA